MLDIQRKPATVLTDLPVAPQSPRNWPQYDPTIDEFVMTSPTGGEVFGQTVAQCLDRYNDALRVAREHETRNGWNCLMCGIQQPAWAGDCLTCESSHD